MMATFAPAGFPGIMLFGWFLANGIVVFSNPCSVLSKRQGKEEESECIAIYVHGEPEMTVGVWDWGTETDDV